MKKVFLFGSLGFSSLPESLERKIEEIAAKGWVFLVGDAPGADFLFQRKLFEMKYPHVKIYHSGKPRNILDNSWKTRKIQADSGLRGREWHTVKDKAMTSDADYGLGLWNGESRGSRANILRLQEQAKYCLFFHSPSQSFLAKLENTIQEEFSLPGMGQ